MARCWSNITPRLLHDDDGETISCPMEIWMRVEMGLCGDVMRRNSVLSSLIFNLLVIIQVLISEIHSPIELRTSYDNHPSSSSSSSSSSPLSGLFFTPGGGVPLYFFACLNL